MEALHFRQPSQSVLSALLFGHAPLLAPHCRFSLILVAPTNRKLFAATLPIAAEGDTDASIDDTTTPGAFDLHGCLPT
jgi:hypothetical protein